MIICSYEFLALIKSYAICIILYKECHSTEMTIITLQTAIIFNLDNIKFTALALIYISAAFDHNILTQTLGHFRHATLLAMGGNYENWDFLQIYMYRCRPSVEHYLLECILCIYWWCKNSTTDTQVMWNKWMEQLCKGSTLAARDA